MLKLTLDIHSIEKHVGCNSQRALRENYKRGNAKKLGCKHLCSAEYTKYLSSMLEFNAISKWFFDKAEHK